jgi:hypothetical protein
MRTRFVVALASAALIASGGATALIAGARAAATPALPKPTGIYSIEEIRVCQAGILVQQDGGTNDVAAVTLADATGPNGPVGQIKGNIGLITFKPSTTHAGTGTVSMSEGSQATGDLLLYNGTGSAIAGNPSDVQAPQSQAGGTYTITAATPTAGTLLTITFPGPETHVYTAIFSPPTGVPQHVHLLGTSPGCIDTITAILE